MTEQGRQGWPSSVLGDDVKDGRDWVDGILGWSKGERRSEGPSRPRVRCS